MKPVTIRKAAETDAATIADLSRITFTQTFGAYNTEANMKLFMETTYDRKKLMEEVSNPDFIFLVAYMEEVPVGYAKLKVVAPRSEMPGDACLEIARIYTLQNMIGRGVGAALMKSCLHIAQEKEQQWIWLGVWEKNEWALEFYRKWGFEKFARQGFLLGNDLQNDWLLRKKIEIGPQRTT